MTHEKLNAFGKLGRLITKRKFAVLGIWILMLAIILPIVLTASGYTSLTFNSSPDIKTESGKASQIIKDHFQNSVSNDSLILVVSTDDASSIETQKFLDELVNKLENDSGITGVENVTSLYTILIPALNGTNRGVYLAYNNGNLTYNLLYSVPTVYSKVWEAAYNAAVDQLVPGLNQSNHGVYALIPAANQSYQMLYGVPYAYTSVYNGVYNYTRDSVLAPNINQTNFGVQTALYNANMTCNLLYSPGALFLQFWSANYATTTDVTQANNYAYSMTDAALQAADPVAYAAYTSNILNSFYTEWQTDFTTAPAAAATAIQASAKVTQDYIGSLTNATEQGFVTAVTNTLTFENFLSYTQDQKNAVLTQLAIGMVATQGSVSPVFVTEAYGLGTAPTLAQLTNQAEAILTNGTKYGMGDFRITLSNETYYQTASVLQAQAPTEYATYLAPLLNIYNSTWVNSFSFSNMSSYTVMQRASWATNTTSSQYINLAFSGNATAQSFANALTHAFSLDVYANNLLSNNNNLQGQLEDFSINYVASQGGISAKFVSAAYHLGTNPSSSTLTSKAKDIIWHPDSYNMGTNFVSTFNQASYDNAKSILDKADHKSYVDYTSHMLNYFNTSWATRVPSSASDTSWINGTAASAANEAINKFVANYLADNADFANGIKNTFSLQDYLNGNSSYTNAKLYNFSIGYVADESGLSKELIAAVYNLGENATLSQLQTFASDLVYDPELYNVGEQLDTAISSFVSPNNDVTLISVTFTEKGDGNLLRIRNITQTMLAQNPGDVTGIEVTGSDAISYDYMQATNSDLDLILPVTIALLVIATALFFRSIVTPIVTLGTIGVGLGVSQIFLYLVGMYVNSVDYTVSTVLLTVLLGVGTDYSIFIIARHREERINGLPLFDAIKQSITWAGESIVTSGATVIISFLALATTTTIMLQTMGLVIGLGVIVTLLASLTVAPALTAILGDRIFWPNSGKRFEKYAEGIREKNQQRGGYFAGSGKFSVKHGKAIILIAIVVTVPCFYLYATTTQTYDVIGSASNNLESIAGMNTLTASFGGGRMLPSYVVVTFNEPILYSDGTFNNAEMSTVNSISQYISSHSGVDKVTGPTMPFGTSVAYQTITNDTDSTTYNQMLTSIGNDNSSVIINVQFTAEPYSTTAMDVAKDVRTNLHSNYDNAAGVTQIALGGTTGSILDERGSFEGQFNQILPLVALGVGIVLFLVLGSLILPIFAILSVLMSIVWTLAATILVFQSAFSYGLLFMTPLILFVLLLGLGMDYNIFILTRIREEAAKGQKQNDAIVHAIQQTGGIITAAAIILAGSLGALMLSSNKMLMEMGFAFAFSILVDALVVRTYLVPAVMATFGKWNWYNPIKRLRRVKDNGKANTAETPTAASQPETEEKPQ